MHQCREVGVVNFYSPDVVRLLEMADLLSFAKWSPIFTSGRGKYQDLSRPNNTTEALDL